VRVSTLVLFSDLFAVTGRMKERRGSEEEGEKEI
jgi:hypothetical protein